MPDEARIRPTIETVLERLQDFRSAVETRLDSLDSRVSSIEERLDQMDTRLDRALLMVHEMRADFREFRTQFKQPA